MITSFIYYVLVSRQLDTQLTNIVSILDTLTTKKMVKPNNMFLPILKPWRRKDWTLSNHRKI